MNQELFWKNRDHTPLPSVSKPLCCEYLIVGGGIAGLVLAYELGVKQGKDVIVVEQNLVGSGSTGRSAGLIAVDTEEWFWHESIARLGQELAQEFANELHDSMHYLKQLIRTHQIHCDFEEMPYYFLSPSGVAQVILQKDFKARKQLHLQGYLLGKSIINKLFFQKGTLKLGESLHNAYSVNPLMLAQNLATHLLREGVRVYEQAVFKKIDDKPQVNGQNINCKKTIVCVNTDRRNDKEIHRYKTSIAITHPLSDRQLTRSRLKKKKAFEEVITQDTYWYGKMTRDNRLLLGFGDEPVPEGFDDLNLVPEHLTKLEELLTSIFPEDNPGFSHAWSGIYAMHDRFLFDDMDLTEPIIHLRPRGTQIHSIAQALVLARLL